MKVKKKGFLRILKRIFCVCICMAVAGFAALTGINIYVKGSVKSKIITIDEAAKLTDVDCIIVLGASVRNGDTPSPMLADRLDRGIELYYAGCSPKIIMSGDHGSMYYNEVTVMKNYAIARGVPSEDIFLDHAGFSTYESMYRAKEIFGAKKVLIVTQEYHLTRAIYNAEKLGLEAYGVAAAGNNYNGQTARDVREYLAIGKDFFATIIKPEPTVLGTPVSLEGSGDVTNDKEE